jgi:uncharacterized protein YprB with RNaseH-like and TPR domain
MNKTRDEHNRADVAALAEMLQIVLEAIARPNSDR